jgi:IS5 family transposase
MTREIQGGFFDAEYRLQDISKQGDPLEKLNQHIDWEMFRPVLEEAFLTEDKDPSSGGRPPYDYVMMFKILILQHLYNIADERTEFAIKDRLSFMRFLGLNLTDRVPDEKTIWLFRETLTKSGEVKRLFKRFHKHLDKMGLITHKGSIVDASFFEVPRQRNTREENEDIKSGKVPDDWKDDPDKLRQKDVDARWTIKNGVKFFGYKDHAKVDRKSKLITNYDTSDASVHDSQKLDDLIEKNDAHHDLFGDSAYSSEDTDKKLKRRKIRNRIHERGYRNHPLTLEQEERNRMKSKIRVRIEHVFGFMENTMKAAYIRCIGGVRAAAVIGLINLTYNLCRSVQLCKT